MHHVLFSARQVGRPREKATAWVLPALLICLWMTTLIVHRFFHSTEEDFGDGS